MSSKRDGMARPGEDNDEEAEEEEEEEEKDEDGAEEEKDNGNKRRSYYVEPHTSGDDTSDPSSDGEDNDPFPNPFDEDEAARTARMERSKKLAKKNKKKRKKYQREQKDIQDATYDPMEHSSSEEQEGKEQTNHLPPSEENSHETGPTARVAAVEPPSDDCMPQDKDGYVLISRFAFNPDDEAVTSSRLWKILA